jgi:hypothetical protein
LAKLAILAQAHVGHTPGVDDPSERNAGHYCLTTQIQNAVEAFDAVKSTFGANTKILVLGHSIGSWIALQVRILANIFLNAAHAEFQVLKARPKTVCGLFLLFPTISHIGNTPNGRSLSVSLLLLPESLTKTDAGSSGYSIPQYLE